jgi:predicted pyridoxine 5'-phosphate oxidase superfamily flavin-nucleotide-binding protein
MTTFYGEQQRSLQDQFDSREIADVLAAVIVRPDIDDEAKAFIESRTFFFLSTVNADGQPTVSHKGGAAGFVRVIDRTTIVFPSYDGNGMFLSMGNIAGDGRIGLLFVDFERPHRVRAHAHAVVTRDDPMMGDFPGADLIVRATVTDVFVKCPRYISPHTPGAVSRYVPDANGESPLPGWKKIDALQPFLSTRFQGLAETENDLITADEYGQRLHRGDG